MIHRTYIEPVAPVKVQIDNDRQAVQADKPIELVCRAFGSSPAASISWFLAGKPLEGQTSSDAGRQLVATKQNRRHDHDHGHRHRRPSVGGDEQQQAPPTRITSLGGLGHLEHSSGQSVSVDDDERNLNNASQSILVFVPQIEDNGQTITCRAENTQLARTSGSSLESQSRAIEDSWTLEVHYLPRVRLSLGEKLVEDQIKEGNDVYFECSVKARPIASEIRWWFEGRELETNISSGIIISNQSLVLQRVQRKQRGRYTCSAINSIGESHSNSIHLRIHYAPFCRDQAATGNHKSNNNERPNNITGEDPFGAMSQQRHKTVYGVARMEQVRVYCHVDADPTDSVSFRWAFLAADSDKERIQTNPIDLKGQALVYLEDSSIKREANSGSESGWPPASIATYTPRSELDYGFLLCWAQNSVGQQAEPCVYRIVSAERPDPVAACRVVNATHSQLIVACEPGYDGGMNQTIQMEIYDTQRRELVANVTSSKSLLANFRGVLDNLSTRSNARLAEETQFELYDQQDDPLKTRPETGGLKLSASNRANAASRQQKQRHSSASKSAHAPKGTEDSNDAEPTTETLFITEPILEPSTSYLLSVYAVNPKGSSKPLAFTATTANLTYATEAELASVRVANRLGRKLGKLNWFYGASLSYIHS